MRICFALHARRVNVACCQGDHGEFLLGGKFDMIVGKLKHWFAKPDVAQYPYGGPGPDKLHMPYRLENSRGVAETCYDGPHAILKLSPEKSHGAYPFR